MMKTPSTRPYILLMAFLLASIPNWGQTDKSTSCGILIEKNAQCTNCQGLCFLLKDIPFGKFIYNEYVSQYFSNAMLDSCGMGITQLLRHDEVALQIEQAVSAVFLHGFCSTETQELSFIEDLRLELLLGLKRKPNSLIRVADTLLKSGLNDGLIVLWSDFDPKHFPTFESYLKNEALREKNFFVLSDLFMLMYINDYQGEMAILWKEIEGQKEDFPEYFQRLIYLQSMPQKPPFGKYYETMYFD